MKYPKVKTRSEDTKLLEGYDCRDCGGGDVCCDCCMRLGLHGNLPTGADDFFAEALRVLEMLADALEDNRPFTEYELIEAIEDNAVAVCYGERFLVWVPHNNLVDFIHPLFTQILENEQLPILLDDGLAMFDLTELCEVHRINMAEVYDDTEL